MTIFSSFPAPLIRSSVRPLSMIMAASLLVLAPATAQQMPVADAPITEAELAADIRLLSHDAFQGRDLGGAGEMRTIAHLVGSWAAAGLQPIANSDTPWLQAVPLIRSRQINGMVEFAHNGQKLGVSADDLAIRLSVPDLQLADVPLIFVGHGLDGDGKVNPNVAGKLVLLLAGAPPFMDNPPSLSDRQAQLVAAGAAGIITAVDDDMPWPKIRESHVAASIDRNIGSPDAPLDVMLSLRGLEQLAQAMGRQTRGLHSAAASPHFRAEILPIQINAHGRADIDAFDSHNVIAKIAGANPDGKAVIVMGHWDGLGRCAPDAADAICNGAVDNASGLAVINAVAKRLATGPKMDRDVYFLATSAEEIGLKGAFHFVDHPVLRLTDIVVALNLDTVAIAPRGTPVATVGRGRPTYDKKVEDIAKSLGRRVDKDGEADKFVFRQDGWAFGAKGVPALMVGGSFSDMTLLNAYLSGNYHRPGDEMNAAIVLGGAAEDGDLHVKLVRAFASRTEWPACTSKARAKR